MKKPLLRVRPNPYHALDAEGMPAGMVRVDPEVGRPGAIEFVGVVVRKDVIKGEISKGDFNEKRERQYQRRTTSLAYAQDVVEIQATSYHIDAVRSGALIAEDKDTARACRIWFVEPAAALEQAKAKAIAEWRASHGEDPPVKQWAEAVSPTAKATTPPKDPDELPLLRPWDAPIEQGADAPKVK